MSNAYQQAGVDIHKGYEAVERMKKHVARTKRPEVLNQIGSFGALFALDKNQLKEPILVSGTDGVGTKILLAQQANKLDTIGIDCVAMCINDVLAQGAEPLFFLDYLAVGENNPQNIEKIVAGVAEGCVQSGAALIGGETAEMPDLYDESEFDLAGFAVGVVDKSLMLDGSKVSLGDQLIGLPSSGIHSNGYSLVRKVFFKDHQWKFEDCLPSGQKLIDVLLEPTRIYVKDVLPFVKDKKVTGISHITGGGFYENLPRMYQDQLAAKINGKAWEIPEIFNIISELGNIPMKEMFNIFNMGMGMVIAVKPEDVEEVLQTISGACHIGEMVEANSDQSQIVIEGI